MIRKKIILILLFLFLSVSAVSASDNAIDNSTLTDFNNDIQLQGVDDSSGLESDEGNVNETSKDNSIENPPKAVSKFSAKDVTSKYGVNTKFSVKLLDSNGNALSNKPVTFKVAGKTCHANSSSSGVATISFKLDAGKYTITYSADGLTGKNTIKINNAYTIKIYKWKSGADVTKNKKIKKNIPNSKLVKKIVKAAKKGTPLVKFTGGKGKKVFITSGVHGNELSSKIAAMKLIKYLESHPIKGTVYIMPFINPKATSKNVRNFNGVNLNEKANVKGTISYKTVKIIKKFKCDAYGDFHCTRPGGKPGKDVAMGTYKPTSQSASMAKYIAKHAKVKHIIYKKAGSEYPGALEDVVSLNGIPAVTCEVITPHGKIAKGSVPKSLLMMKVLLKYNSLL